MVATRRQLLHAAAAGGFGTLAFGSDDRRVQAASQRIATGSSALEFHPLPSADRFIFLHMRGGPAAMETYERKPTLDRYAEQRSDRRGRQLSPSHWKWKRRGESGLWVSELVRHTAELADELCVLSGMHSDFASHLPAMRQLHTGSGTGLRPSLGAWLLHGRGTENESLPGFISISPPQLNGGCASYGSACLPAACQGATLIDATTPVLDATPNVPADRRRSGARIPELADAIDLSRETAETLSLYGIGDGRPSDHFGRQCLVARRMVEAGVRHIEVSDEFWDQHNALVRGHNARAAATDKPIAGLLTDLRRRGLLDRTLVLWGGEFGRTPDTAKQNLDGRDHNPAGYTMWLAGGGVRRGFQYGSTDELGYRAVSGRVHLRDLHATVLHLMGLDHQRLTYRHAGHDFRPTDGRGRVVHEIIA